MAFYYGIHNVAQFLMSAFGGKADIDGTGAECIGKRMTQGAKAPLRSLTRHGISTNAGPSR